MYWYLNLTSVVKWNDTFSRSFRVTSGVRQGGILSPRIFVVYVDDLLRALRESGVGCHILGQFVAAIMYADDLALLAPTRSALQRLLNICQTYGTEWCITYNSSKTTAMLIGKSLVSGFRLQFILIILRWPMSLNSNILVFTYLQVEHLWLLLLNLYPLFEAVRTLF